MDRDDLIDAGTQAICEMYVPTATADEEVRWEVGVVVDAVEPVIRADERERNTPLDITAYRAALLAGLRAKVEALPERGISMTWDHPEGCALVWRDEVLALLDGTTDEPS
jgi:hypothetical protein